MEDDSQIINVGDLVFIKSSATGEPMIEAGICLVVAKDFGPPGDASLIKKNKEIFAILWKGFIDDSVDPEWLLLVKK